VRGERDERSVGGKGCMKRREKGMNEAREGRDTCTYEEKEGWDV
jgi:hypothetical protein